MFKVAFLTTHLHSGAEALFDVLSQNPRVQGCRWSDTGVSEKSMRYYSTPASLFSLTASGSHKLRTKAAVYLDVLLFNHSMVCRKFYDICKFVYVVREARPTLNALVASGVYEEPYAMRYYAYRLRRLCEMARRTPGAVLLTWDDICTGRGYPLLEKYLGLKQSLEHRPELYEAIRKGPSSDLVKWSSVERAQACYERHLYFLRSQKLLSPAAT